MAGGREGALWPVDHAVTAQFMAGFYRALAAQASCASALQQAQADVWQVQPHAFYWAGFALPGLALAADPVMGGEVLGKLRSNADLPGRALRHGLRLQARFGARPIFRLGEIGSARWPTRWRR